MCLGIGIEGMGLLAPGIGIADGMGLIAPGIGITDGIGLIAPGIGIADGMTTGLLSGFFSAGLTSCFMSGRLGGCVYASFVMLFSFFPVTSFHSSSSIASLLSTVAGLTNFVTLDSLVSSCDYSTACSTTFTIGFSDSVVDFG